MPIMYCMCTLKCTFHFVTLRKWGIIDFVLFIVFYSHAISCPSPLSFSCQALLFLSSLICSFFYGYLYPTESVTHQTTHNLMHTHTHTYIIYVPTQTHADSNDCGTIYYRPTGPRPQQHVSHSLQHIVET